MIAFIDLKTRFLARTLRIQVEQANSWDAKFVVADIASGFTTNS